MVEPVADVEVDGLVSTGTFWQGAEQCVVGLVRGVVVHVQQVAELVLGTCVPGDVVWPRRARCNPAAWSGTCG